MSNGYLIAADADRDVAHEIGDGFGLDVIDASNVQDHAATVSALASAPNIGLLISSAAAQDARFVALARLMGERLPNVQRIIVDDGAAAAFVFLPGAWPSMSITEARRRIGLRQGGETAAEPPRRAEPLPPTSQPEPPPAPEAPPPVVQDEAPEPPPIVQDEPPPVVAEEPPAPVEQPAEAEEAPPPVVAREEPAPEPPAPDLSTETLREAELDALGAEESDSSDLMGGDSDAIAPEDEGGGTARAADDHVVMSDAEAPEPARKRAEPPAERPAPPAAEPPPAPAPQAPPPVSASPDRSGFGATAGATASRSAPAPRETAPADATAFAPNKLRRGTPELVRIVVHQPRDLQAVIKAARKIDPRTEPAPQGMSVGEIALGASVGVSLEVRGGACDGALQRRTWTGEPIDFSFAVEADTDVKQVVFLARVFVDDAQIGVLAFMRKATGPSKKPANTGDRVRLKRHKRVFLSYSSKDRETVSTIATAYQMAGVEHFFDRTSLKSGEEWSPRLRREIDRSDLFHLCWSKSAAESEWVQKEAEHALTRRRRGAKPEITVQMLDGPPWAKHPPELDTINFDDFVRAAIVGYARGDGSD